MCTRFVLEQTRIRALLAALGLDADGTETTGPVDRHNIAPGTALAALSTSPANPAGLSAFHPRWGFFPAASDSPPLANARAETLAQKPAFRDAFRRRRCLVPATGFYEWEKRGRARLPWLFRLRDDTPFAFAALWENTPDDEARAVIITTAPNALMAPIHHRMPALLATPEACRAWLDPRANETMLATLLAPVDAAAMTATPVSPRMNRADFDSPECVAPAVHGLAARDTTDDDTREFAF
jgi:putative SOS response-associated peptidase YedK